MTGVVVGVDPGFSGAFAAIDIESGVIAAYPMPSVKDKGKSDINVAMILSLLASWDRNSIRLVMIEKTGSHKTDGHMQAYKFGFNVGLLHGIIRGLSLPLDSVSPQRWQQAILGGVRQGGTKAESIAFCKRRWPGLSLLPTSRCTKDSDGIADAACIAEFARRQVVGNGQLSEVS
jgi:hypothetical protein